jgi:uncharacterized surface protein with fasciclin (FAS1) repeats
MRKLLKFPVLLSLVLLLLVRCANDKDAYFERPGWLEPPIYEVLQKQGRFTNYLKCVDRTLYATTLKSSGLSTVFAPNDDAFAKYLNGKSVSDLSDTLVNQIVAYSILRNNYSFDHLTDVLSAGWDTLSSIRKRTAYYNPIYQMNYNGNNVWIYDMPGTGFSIGTVVEQNYKYIPLYLTKVFEKGRTTSQASSDYSMFYPTTYTGSNVQSANIVTKDMVAQNGVVHEVDQVLEPLPNLEKLLDDPDYSEFKSLINMRGTTGDPFFVSYQYSDVLTKAFTTAMPDKNINAVYLKYYTGLPFTLSGERYGTSTKEAEQGGFTMFAPNNAAIEKFYNDKLKAYYPGGIQTVPVEVLYYFINAQLINDMVWPGDFKGSMNSLGEFFNGKGATGPEFDKAKYTKLAPASNGLFYGSNDYIKSRYFETVYTEILLNPTYSLLNTAFANYYATTLKEELLRCELNGYTQENYTVLLPSDDLLRADGFSWAWISGATYDFLNSNSGSTLGSFVASDRMKRLVRSHIFKRLKNNQVNCAITSFTTDPSFASAYGGYSYAVNDYGDMIRYKDGKIQMLGNYDENDWVTATPFKTFINGQVFKIDKLLQYSPRNTAATEPLKYTSQALSTYLKNTAIANDNVSTFVKYLTLCLGSSDATVTELSGISADMTLTVLMPSNAAMSRAVKNGDLPAYSLVSGGSTAAIQKATKFILYHIINGKEYVDDGLTYIMPNKEVVKEEVAPTLLKDIVDNTYLAVSKDAAGRLVVSTIAQSTGRNLSTSIKSVPVTRIRSNYFGSKAVLHEINDYFIYNKVQ